MKRLANLLLAATLARRTYDQNALRCRENYLIEEEQALHEPQARTLNHGQAHHSPQTSRNTIPEDKHMLEIKAINH